MDRMSGWFKDLMRKRVFIISIFVAVGLNVDSINLFKSLYTSPTLRSQLSPVAESLADNYAIQKQDTSLSALQQAYKAAAITQLKKVNSDSAFGELSKAVSGLSKLDSLGHRQDTAKMGSVQRVSDQLSELAALHIPIGWHKGIPPISQGDKPLTGFWILWYLLGLAITVFSISAGAPFWFDLLLKVVNIRRAGKKPE